MKENILPSLPTNFLLVFVGVFHPFTSPRLKQPHGGITLFGVGRFDGRLGPRHGGALPRRHGAAGGNQAIHLNNGLHGGRRGNPLPKQQQKWWTKCVGFFFEGCIYTMYSWCTGYISFCSDSLFFFATSLFWTWKSFTKKHNSSWWFFANPFQDDMNQIASESSPKFWGNQHLRTTYLAAHVDRAFWGKKNTLHVGNGWVTKYPWTYVQLG